MLDRCARRSLSCCWRLSVPEKRLPGLASGLDAGAARTRPMRGHDGGVGAATAADAFCGRRGDVTFSSP